MNESGGWICLFKKFTKWEWYQDINTKIVFLHLLITANYYDTKWQGKEIKRGQLVTSINHLAEDVNLSVHQVRTALDKLKMTNEITIKTTNKYTLITIVKYSFYQSRDDESGKQIDNQMTNERQSNDNQMATNKQINNITINNNNNNIGESCVDGLDDVIEYYKSNILKRDSIISPYEEKVLKNLTEKLKKELMILAIEKALDANIKNLAYIKGVANNWINKNIKTITEAEKEDKLQSKNKKKNLDQRQYKDAELDNFYANEGE